MITLTKEQLAELLRHSYAKGADDSNGFWNDQEHFESSFRMAIQNIVQGAAHADVILSFEYVGPNQERRTVAVSRDDIAEHMEEQLFHKLTAAVCMCDPEDSDNCRCDEYAEQFTLRAQRHGEVQ